MRFLFCCAPHGHFTTPPLARSCVFLPSAAGMYCEENTHARLSSTTSRCPRKRAAHLLPGAPVGDVLYKTTEEQISSYTSIGRVTLQEVPWRPPSSHIVPRQIPITERIGSIPFISAMGRGISLKDALGLRVGATNTLQRPDDLVLANVGLTEIQLIVLWPAYEGQRLVSVNVPVSRWTLAACIANHYKQFFEDITKKELAGPFSTWNVGAQRDGKIPISKVVLLGLKQVYADIFCAEMGVVQ
ncbi:hypothetical protein SCP_1005480 [Sparassis crispa]|uniref:Uncharacterized protein n=1 Tax=Sparassis crispa TaxID=139825 RepID=A0A401GYR4_9APHY|nr:hypothetical protein SCP_1005480 [Sparassis crispa]GBE87300.1 hypothetical protein SCP_1005480 [Sparassis crispa]